MARVKLSDLSPDARAQVRKAASAPRRATKQGKVVSVDGSGGELALAGQIAQAGLPEPEREYRFHPTRRWRADFAFVSQRILVEVEGGTKAVGRSRHTSAAGYENDCEKYSEAALMGFVVLRVTTDMVHDGRAIDLIRRALA